MSETENTPQEQVARFREDIARVKAEVGKMIVGQDEIVDGVLTCLLAGGQALLEGVPGLGKTMLVRTLAGVLRLDFSRIQFTPDLMPADIIGTTVLTEGEGGKTRLEFRPGPVFANIVLADEVNRATPKTQSAMLEVMQEHSVTVSNRTHKLEEPYFVLATQNPLEMEGTYPLPEAQLDRFLFKLEVGFPSREEMHAILDRTTGSETPEVQPVMGKERILAMRKVVRDVAVAHHVKDYAIRVLEATHPDRPSAPEKVQRFVRFGGSPRGAQALLLAAKIHALMDGRFAAAIDDVRWAVKPALRHRIILNFEGEAEGVRPDAVLDDILASVPESIK
ncbi:MAG: AAA family ATPase [Sandaracinus sp.]|nr:AAA family ATPase [Sandaracinus sp.]|tara:strand:+ start:113 stop:1117 length:1005 start_codon:yes stop_codon:yes gene_type:complete